MSTSNHNAGGGGGGVYLAINKHPIQGGVEIFSCSHILILKSEFYTGLNGHVARKQAKGEGFTI